MLIYWKVKNGEEQYTTLFPLYWFIQESEYNYYTVIFPFVW